MPDANAPCAVFWPTLPLRVLTMNLWNFAEPYAARMRLLRKIASPSFNRMFSAPSRKSHWPRPRTAKERGASAAECGAAAWPVRPNWSRLLAKHGARYAKEDGTLSLQVAVPEPDLPTDERLRRLRVGQHCQITIAPLIRAAKRQKTVNGGKWNT